MTMTYDVTGHLFSIGDQPSEETTNSYRFTFTSEDSWIEEVIAAPDVVLRVGTFSEVGSYQRLDGNQYTVYDSITGSTRTETVEEGIYMIPQSALFGPMPLSGLKEHVDSSPEKIATTTRVCFNDDCTANTEGWRFVDGELEFIYADDARGIPLQIGSFVIKEIQVHGDKQPLPVDFEEDAR